MFIIITIIVSIIASFVILLSFSIALFTAEIGKAKHKADYESARNADITARLIERRAEAERRAMLHEAKIARENNAVLLQDLKIEVEKLKLAALEKEINPPAFDPGNYHS